MASVTTEWKTGTTSSIWSPSETAYHFNGSICCLCFLIGTLGNIVSFFYFRSKKRDISNVIYMLITANDIVVSITVLPVGISFLSKRQPGLIFGNKYGCIIWDYLWRIAVSFSVFLVLCLCVTRTISLLRPFKRQKTKYLLLAVVTYLLIVLALIIIIKYIGNARTSFHETRSRCDMNVDPDMDRATFIFTVCNNIFYTAPAIAVALSCVISVVVLTRRNRNVQQRELQQSRNRATVTILLFALLYGICNIPLVVDFMLFTYCLIRNDWQIYNIFKFQLDKHHYFDNAAATLLLAANSAANPILYFWRMPALREYIMSGMRRMLGLNREVRRPALQQAETRRCNTVEEGINFKGQNTEAEE